MGEVNLKLPARYKFMLLRNIDTGRQDIVANEVKSRAKTENLKFNDLRSFSLNSNEKFTPLEVKEVETEQEFRDIMEDLTIKWGAYGRVDNG